MKKSLVFTMCIILILLSYINVFSAQIPDSQIEPLVNTPCSGGNGICQMKSQGWGSAYDYDTGNLLLNMYCCWQCKNCLTAMLTQGDPTLGQPIGIYVMVSHYEKINTYLSIFYIRTTDLKYTGLTSMEGYRFSNVY